MQSRQPTLVLSVGLAASVLAHVAVVAPLLVTVMSAAGGRHVHLRGQFDPQDIRPRTDEIALGVETSAASTLTWIGYEQYQQHLAALAEIEQAAFRTNPAGEAQPSPDEGVSTPVADAPATLTGNVTAEPADPLAELTAWLDSLGGDSASPEPTTRVTAGTSPSDHKALLEVLAALQRLLSTPVESPRANQSDDATRDQGTPAEKESDPTSIIDVPRENWQLGKPIAAQGVQIRPRKPSFTTVVLLTAAPANPLCEIHFRHDGKPALARIIESSGDARVDEAILNSLYRWRATGKRLDALADDETITVRIQIMLVRTSGS
ncbi:MAG: hypothetical protein O7C65_02545 [Planctomycetota bacterium]|nr:hypothetical protein [Planctomycetota bacterium]